MPPIIRTHHLDKFYETGYGRTYVLRRVDLEVEEGATIVQVTHSELNASYGNRVVYLKDGIAVLPAPPMPTSAQTPP